MITAQDVIDGNVTNQAMATGTPPVGPDVNDTSDNDVPNEDDPTVTPLTPAPGIALVKTVASVSGTGTIGDVITYTMAVSNTGNVPLTNVNVTDANAVVTGGPIATLAVGATDNTTITATHTITPQDVIDGNVTNQAIATGTPPVGPDVNDTSDNDVPNEDDPTVTPLTPAPGIALVKTVASVSGTGTIGDVITYTMAVSNTGNVPLTNVNVTDANAVVTGGPIATLAVGATDNTTITATHAITPQDVIDGNVTNQAIATGTPPVGPDVNDTSDNDVPNEDDPTVTPLTPAPGIALVKTVASVSGTGTIGDVITYTMAVSNTGNVPLTNVNVTDANAVVTGGPIATLAVGATDNTTITATHAITPQDVIDGNVTNQAIATGTPPVGPDVNDTSDNDVPNEDDPTVTPLTPAPGIALVKTVASVSGTGTIGDVITYTMAVSNTGNVPLTNVNVTDANAVVTGGPIATLAVGATDNTTITATHAITPQDVIDGNVTNQAIATGTPPVGPDVNDTSDNDVPNEDDPTVTPLTPAPGIALVKTVASVSGTGTIGDVITYTMAVSNTGNVPLTNVNVTDANAVVTGGPIATLAVGATDNTTITATHAITPQDVIDGNVTNQAIATGTPPVGPDVNDTSDNDVPNEDDPTVTPLTPAPGIALVKTVASVSGTGTIGDVITYTMAVSNTGNVPLSKCECNRCQCRCYRWSNCNTCSRGNRQHNDHSDTRHYSTRCD